MRIVMGRTGQYGETDLEGEVSHQTALHGILAKINDLGPNIILVEKNTPCKKEE